MDRNDLQKLAHIRLREAKALLSAGLCDGAYYLAGYAVECALKACIAKSTRRYEFPDRQRVNASYTHNLDELIKHAGLKDQHKSEMSGAPFAGNWGIVKEWSEESRYETHSEDSARLLLNAINDRTHGVMAWIKRYW